MNKIRWFKFFFVYKEAFTELNPFECKKLILAICDYAEAGFLPTKLNKRTMRAFESFKAFFDTDIEISRNFGKKGAKYRWNAPKNREPIAKNREPKSKK